jgi:hypothetical protein
MKFKQYVFLLLTIAFFCPGLKAQQLNDVEDRISAMPETPETLYFKAREYIYQNLKNNNSGEISAVIRLFSEKYHDTIPVLYPNERILFDYWSGNYDDLLKAISAFGLPGYYSIYYQLFDARYYKDWLRSEIFDYFCEHQIELYNRLSRNDLSAQDLGFLNLFLTVQLQYSACTSKVIGEFDLPLAVGQYMQEFPDSPYNRFLKEQLSPDYVASPFGFGFQFHSGWGDYLKDYDEYFKYGGIFGMGLDLEWNRVKSFYYFNLGFGRTKKEFDQNNEFWEKNQRVINGSGGISLGYAVIDTRSIAVIPNYGVDWLSVEQNNPDNNTDEKEPTIKLKGNHLVGLTLDWNISKKQETTSMNYNNFMYSGVPSFTRAYVRLKFGYLIPHGSSYITVGNQVLDGRAYYVNIGIGMTIYPRKKVRY